MTLLLLLACYDGPKTGENLPPEDTAPFPADCTLLAAGERLDLDHGCADGACNDMEYEEVVAALGEPDSCDGFGSLLFCDWQGDQVTTFFDDEDEDEVADENATARGMYVYAPWDGASEEGLGLGIAVSCFEEAFGEATDTTYIEVDGEPVKADLDWPENGVYLSDGADGNDPDGLVDRLGIFGR